MSSISSTIDATELREYCRGLGREGIYNEVVELARQITEDNIIPQDIMKLVGEIQAIAIGAKCDMYLYEKVAMGFYRRLEKAQCVNSTNTPITEDNLKFSMYCPYCNKEAEWVENSEIYGKRYGKSYMAYLCRDCNAYVGCHNNTRTPLGILANKELREARQETHAVIDPLWKSGKYKRNTIYIRLQEAFGEEIHVGESDLQRCKEIQETARLIFTNEDKK